MVKRVVKDVPRAASDPIVTAVAEGTSDDPFAVLGRHLTTLGGQPAVVIRTIQPFATSVDLVTPKGSVPMVRRDDGIYEVSVDLDGQAAHDFVSTYVPPATSSKWARDVRAFADVEDPRPYIDEVQDDEFPLSMFYSSLKGKLDVSRPTMPA